MSKAQREKECKSFIGRCYTLWGTTTSKVRYICKDMAIRFVDIEQKKKKYNSP